jgi:hypothetical protein
MIPRPTNLCKNARSPTWLSPLFYAFESSGVMSHILENQPSPASLQAILNWRDARGRTALDAFFEEQNQQRKHFQEFFEQHGAIITWYSKRLRRMAPVESILRSVYGVPAEPSKRGRSERIENQRKRARV